MGSHDVEQDQVKLELLLPRVQEHYEWANRATRFAAKGRFSTSPSWAMPMAARTMRGMLRVTQYWARVLREAGEDVQVPEWKTFVDVPIEGLQVTPFDKWLQKVTPVVSNNGAWAYAIYQKRLMNDKKTRRFVNQIYSIIAYEAAVVLDDVVEIEG
jgi:hypothetical protein